MLSRWYPDEALSLSLAITAMFVKLQSKMTVASVIVVIYPDASMVADMETDTVEEVVTTDTMRLIMMLTL